MALLVRGRGGELADPHVPRVERGDEALDRAALAPTRPSPRRRRRPADRAPRRRSVRRASAAAAAGALPGRLEPLGLLLLRERLASGRLRRVCPLETILSDRRRGSRQREHEPERRACRRGRDRPGVTTSSAIGSSRIARKIIDDPDRDDHFAASRRRARDRDEEADEHQRDVGGDRLGQQSARATDSSASRRASTYVPAIRRGRTTRVGRREVREGLDEVGYLADEPAALVSFLAQRLGKPVLVEGPGRRRQDRAGEGALARDRAAS